jgi:L-serine dehydratase
MVSLFDLFKIGIGPSSSHTVGPMKAAAAFAGGLAESGAIDRAAAVNVTLFGSLAFTGKGHATDKAVTLGLCGLEPDGVDPDMAEETFAEIRASKRLRLGGRRAIAFDPATAIAFDVLTPAPRHPNTLRLVASDTSGATLADETWLSIGGGFVARGPSS